MKKMQSGIFALLLLCGFISCKKEISSTEDVAQTKGRPVTSAPVAELPGNEGECTSCVTDFTASQETASSNAVLKLEGGVLTAVSSTLTTVTSTVETKTVDNISVTVSHDAQNVYFTLERSNGTGEFGNLRFFSPAVIPVPTNGAGNFGVPAGIKKIQIVRSREGLQACSEISFSFHVGGGGSASNGSGSVTTPDALKYTLKKLCPTCTINIGDYRTYGRGTWRNKNGVAFLEAHSELFPFTIGDGSYTKSFDDAVKVGAYLDEKGEANGTPSVFPQGSTYAAQVLTLAINVKTDAMVADFSKAEGGLANLTVAISDADILAHPEWASLVGWNGKSVKQILDIAQKVLGGTSTEFLPSHMNELVTAINENFEGGTIDNGLLTCGN